MKLAQGKGSIRDAHYLLYEIEEIKQLRRIQQKNRTMTLSENKLQQAYELDHDLDRVDEIDGWEELGSADIFIVDKSIDVQDLCMAFCETQPVDSVDEITTEGVHMDLEELDYVFTNPYFPVMSKRMLSVLKSIGDFPHQTIPVTIKDIVLVTGADGKLQPSGKINTDYVAVQLLEHLDIIDREKSIYESVSFDPNYINLVDKLVLQIPEVGLPPIFRLANYPTVIYVSPKAKTALEEAGIAGIRFAPIDELKRDNKYRLKKKAKPNSIFLKRKINDLTEELKIKAWYPKVRQQEGSLLDSKFLGKPYLLPGEQYPHCSNCGKPMQLFVQLNLNTLPEGLAGVFGSGLLQLFYCTSTEPHCDSDCDANVAFADEPGMGKLIRIVEPMGDEEDYELPIFERRAGSLCVLEWQSVSDRPSLLDLEHYESLFSSSEWNRLYDIHNFPLSGDKLGGYPLWIQGDYRPQCPRCQTTMEYIFQLDCEGVLPFDFGGNGCGHITQCPNHKEIIEFTYECT